MSTNLKTSRGSWITVITSAGLAILLPYAAMAQSPHAEPSGIVIPIPLSQTPPPVRYPSASKNVGKLKALPRRLPTIEYTSLPAGDLTADRDMTGSLPGSDPLAARVPSGFSSLVARGTIALRDTTPTGCLPGGLLDVVAEVADKFGAVSVESTHRSAGQNRRAGGVRHSLHLSCRALDFRVRTRTRGVMAYLRSRPEVGGLKIYRNGIIHIDNGQHRSW